MTDLVAHAKELDPEPPLLGRCVACTSDDLVVRTRKRVVCRNCGFTDAFAQFGPTRERLDELESIRHLPTDIDGAAGAAESVLEYGEDLERPPAPFVRSRARRRLHKCLDVLGAYAPDAVRRLRPSDEAFDMETVVDAIPELLELTRRVRRDLIEQIESEMENGAAANHSERE